MGVTQVYARNYLSGDFKPLAWNVIEPIMRELAERKVPTASDLEQWLLDISEVQAALDEEASRRNIAKDVDTSNVAAMKAYLEWIEGIDPQLKPYFFQIQKNIASHPAAGGLPADEFGCYLRRVRNAVDIFREANIPLETEDSKLSTEFDTISGAQTVQFDGTERTMPQMTKYLERPDRAVREQAFRAMAARRAQDYERLESIFDKMQTLRKTMADNAGMTDYRALVWRGYNRFDYTPGDCLEFISAVEKACVPRLKALQRKRRERLEVNTLRPWDIDVDISGDTPLNPFASPLEFIDKTRKTFACVDPALAAHFDLLIDNGLLDLESRKGKAPGGYQATLQERRLPFIFMNAAGRPDDVETLLHEGGHAFHAVERRELRLTSNRSAPIEFCEVASMSMELIAGMYLDRAFYNKEDARRARLRHLEGIITFFPWMATIDGFQHWLYTHPGHSREERHAHWHGLRARFEGDVDWTGFEINRAKRWTQQGHLFWAPFYYVEYGIAQLGALQIWRNYLDDPKQAIKDYRYALSLGYTRSLPQLFEAAGISFDFSARMLEDLMRLVEREMVKLGDH